MARDSQPKTTKILLHFILSFMSLELISFVAIFDCQERSLTGINARYKVKPKAGGEERLPQSEAEGMKALTSAL
jgi:hypothetical protein